VDPGQTTLPIAFPTPTDNSRPGQYIVVFRGKLGAEEGAVVGKVTTPIQIYYVSRQGGLDKIYRMDIDGSNKTPLYDNTDPGILLGKLTPNPDGTQVAFTVHRPSGVAEIWLLDLSSAAAGLQAVGEWPSWSPDGSQLVFERELGPGDRAIFRRHIETGNETPLTDVAGFAADGRPAWAPQSDRIAYSRHNGEAADCLSTTEPNIFLINSSGAPIGPVTCRNGKEPDTVFPSNRYALDGAPVWSPTEEEIVFTRKRLDGVDQDTGEFLTFREELFKVTVAGETVTKLTDSTGRAYAELTPSWSPDGKAIAVGSQRDGDFDIWLVHPNGGYRVNLTAENPETDSFPTFVWVP
jgi:Tol biopolymer transport system component